MVARRAALWLLGTYIALKFAMSLNSILNAETIAATADGFPLASYGSDGAQAVLMLFALVGLGQLALAAFALLVLVRERALVPFTFLLLLAEHVTRRLIVQAYAIERAPAGAAGSYVNAGLTVVLAAGLVLSLWPRASNTAPGK